MDKTNNLKFMQEDMEMAEFETEIAKTEAIITENEAIIAECKAIIENIEIMNFWFKLPLTKQNTLNVLID